MIDSIYKLNLNDKNSVIIDNTGKSIACFAVKENVAVDNNTLKDLKSLSVKLGRKDIRICLHNDRDSELHNMINLIYKKKENIPHKHQYKSESYHIIEGRLILTIFENNGEIIDELLLDSRKNYLFRIGKNIFHTTVPDTDFVIFHESRSGPFSEECDSIFMDKKLLTT